MLVSSPMSKIADKDVWRWFQKYFCGVILAVW